MFEYVNKVVFYLFKFPISDKSSKRHFQVIKYSIEAHLNVIYQINVHDGLYFIHVGCSSWDEETLRLNAPFVKAEMHDVDERLLGIEARVRDAEARFREVEARVKNQQQFANKGMEMIFYLKIFHVHQARITKQLFSSCERRLAS